MIVGLRLEGARTGPGLMYSCDSDPGLLDVNVIGGRPVARPPKE